MHHRANILRFVSLVAILLAACVCLGGAAFNGREDFDPKKLSEQYRQDDDDAIWQTKKKKKKLPNLDEELTEADLLDFDDPQLSEMMKNAPKGSDLEVILSNNLRMRREAAAAGKDDLVGMDVSHLLNRVGGGGGGSIKSISAKFKPDVCPLELEDTARRECAELIQRKWAHLLSTGGVPITMPNLNEPWDRISYFFQGAAIGNLPQMKAFLIDQPEVYSVQFDKEVLYGQGVEPPSADEVAAEKARNKEANQRKRAAAAREKLKERKKEQKAAKKAALKRALETGELRRTRTRRLQEGRRQELLARAPPRPLEGRRRLRGGGGAGGGERDAAAAAGGVPGGGVLSVEE